MTHSDKPGERLEPLAQTDYYETMHQELECLTPGQVVELARRLCPDEAAAEARSDDGLTYNAAIRLLITEAKPGALFTALQEEE